MALVLADRVLETTPVAGTGDANLNGAVTGYQPFSVIGGGNTTYYTIVAIDDNGAPTGDWEVGIGTYVVTGNKLQRDTVLSSSNGGAKVYFASGTKQVFLDLPSEEVLLSAGDVNGPASAVNSNFALFDGTTGKLLKDAGINASTFATAAQGAKADTAVQPSSLGTAAYLNAGSANGVATLDAGGKVPTSQIPQMGDLNYQGTWNASTNTPTLTSSAGTKGFYYVVSVAGTTNLNGITDWQVGDWAVFNGSVWQKIDNTDAVTSVNGYTGTVVLTYTDVGAQPAGTYVTSVGATSPVTSTGGTTPTIAIPAATTSVSGYLTSTDWNTFNGKGSGSVTSVSGTGTVSGISLSGTVTTTGSLTLGGTLDLSSPPVIGGTTPNTITGTTINANTKFVSPDYYAQSILGGNLRTSGGTSLLNWDGGGSGNVTVNGGLLANPANKNVSLAPSGTGTVTINPATAGTFNNMVIGGTTPLAGTFTSLTATGTTTLATSLTGIAKLTSGVVSTATSGTDYAPATSGTAILYGNGSGGFSNVTIGSGVSFAGGTLSATGLGGTVTSVTGTSPIVSSGGTTPAISIAQATTSTSGYLSSTDWNTFNSKAPATSGTSILYGNGSGGFSNVTVGSGLSFSAGTLSSTGGAGTVTSIAAGNGMNFTTITGSGTVALGTPSTITSATTNSASGTTHTHALTVTPANVSDQANTSTGYFALPNGTTAQRPGSPTVGMIRYNSTTAFYEIYTGSSWQPITTTPYTYSASYLAVAGGGGGGGQEGGGGAAGGLLASTATLITGTVYTITVGSGGASAGILAVNGGSGTNSVISGTGLTTITAIGGGYGAAGGAASIVGGNGGSGGGSSGSAGASSGTSGQGTAGGAGGGASGNYPAGGGGGATSAGAAGAGSVGGAGGSGTASSITGSSVTYAGGGGGGTFNGGTGGAAGSGGGTAGNSGTDATANTGGGGGGGSNAPLVRAGAGGSGVVILSVPTANYSGVTTGSPTITTSGANTIIKFTASGTYTG